MPVYVRTVGFSLAFSLATAIFGGLTPAISTALVEITGDKSAPGWWLMWLSVNGRSAHSARRYFNAVFPLADSRGSDA
jgi:MHS family citrate/tricarballylate:H+ symporter-like MFS transporter